MTTANSDDRIEGNVALILNDREVLIDRGQIDGVEIGTRFAVLGTYETANARNPKAVLNIDYPKTIVKVVRFQGDDHSVGRTFRTIKGRPARDSLASVASTFEALRSTPDRVETLETGVGETIQSSLGPGHNTVRKGDRVRETRGDEYLDDFV